MVQRAFFGLRQFRNYCAPTKIARCGFPWKKTTKRPAASVCTNCQTAPVAPRNGLQRCRLPLCALFCCLPLLTQAQQIEHIDTPLPDAPTMGIPAAQDAAGQNPGESLGAISGTVVDQNGNFVFSARVRLAREGHTEEREAVSTRKGTLLLRGSLGVPFHPPKRSNFCGPGSGGYSSTRGNSGGAAGLVTDSCCHVRGAG